MGYLNNGFAMSAPTWLHIYGPYVALFFLWSIFWKSVALWHSARKGNNWWFIVLIFVNTAGILEIIYLFGILKLKIDQLLKK